MPGREQEKFLIAATLDPVERGQDFTDVPHMTVLRWFTKPAQWPEFRGNIATLFDRPNVFGRPVGGDHALYGPDKDIAVRELIDVSPWPYIGMIASVRKRGGLFIDEDYAEEYLPHVTDTPSRQVEEGELVHFSSIAIVRRDAQRTKEEIIIAHPLRHENET